MGANPANKRQKPRVMLDANVLIAGTACPRFPYEVMIHALKEDYHLFLTPMVIEEARRNIQKKFPARLPFLEEFLAECTHKLIPEPGEAEQNEHYNLVRDISDIPIALAAISGKIEYFVTNAKDFTASHPTTARLKISFTPVLPAAFLKNVMGWTIDELENIRQRNWQDLKNA